ncbi:MAG: universal stress protein [Gloeomargaritaceae cyanobacterium C42_A2020_066]|nr:universal stress protein [Gloeomargaritaceae cyanobacterium C42_A2020_066]
MLKKILLAVSGTGHTEEMLNALVDLPCIATADITILHVIAPQASADAMVELRQEGERVLAAALQKIHICRTADDKNACLKPSQVTTLLREGDPKDIVPRVAEDMDADLMIMGSRGLGRLRSILENSVSQYVFQLANRPMLLVKDDTYVERINRIMVAYDGSRPAGRSLELALFLLQGLKGGELILAHVNPNLDGVTAEQLQANPEKDPVLAQAVVQIRRQGIAYRCKVSTGKVGEAICRLAADCGADLLLLGSPDRRPTIARSLVDLDRLLGNSISDYVRVHADCPVLLTRTPSE